MDYPIYPESSVAITAYYHDPDYYKEFHEEHPGIDMAYQKKYHSGSKDIYAIFDGEVTYNKIYAGSWLTNTPYLALHRIAIANAKRGCGYSDEIMKFIFKTAKEHSFASVRVDTHTGNSPMRKMVEKNGFEYCGIIHLIDGQQRVAYEKLL